MSSTTFVGNKPVDEIPSQATQQLSNEELTRQEVQRLKEGASEPGANKRAGVASRDPAEFDSQTRSSNAHGDTKPVQDPVL
ncbi:uncharacterized protein STEHIDRAFT_157815 [Stereum hirsutum FP-91666 SS1]|uniref:uncharacterized protein n=1 Tax=Stereum hirsutum (strain FP-91666) TaxID=721885 RepID=UPI0004449EE8|nr:uncharacterized protein STEHIDRAFT_157815 [Stereum hirsutum FP-91666 SS1]EIM86314.1 hypothetical protein STEHIDRAFT_157815 [Stereum hirsutum FP-91666 SS1]